MKARLFAIAMATTFLTPVQAHAGPVAAFVGGAINALTGLGGGILAATGAVGAWTAGFGVGAFFTTGIGGLLGKALLSVGLSALAASFAPQPTLPKPSAIMGNFAQPISYAQWVYGRTRKGGPIGYTGAADKRRFYVPILAAHEIEGVHQHWIDEWTTSLDETKTSFDDGNILGEDSDPEATAPNKVEGKGRIEPFLGGAGQAANAGLVSVFDEVTSAFDFAGLAGGVVWAKKVAAENFSKVYPNGRQWAWTPVIDGNNQIYDPRDDTRKYTNNAALCVAHWITEVLGQQVDWDDVAAEADACDVTVTGADGETRAKWTLNGTLSDDQPFDTQRGQMLGACDGFMYERPDGKVGFTVGRWVEPTVTITDGDCLSCEVTSGQWGSDAPTEISVVYTEPENHWRESPAGTYVFTDDANIVKDEPQLYMITNHNQASRIGKRIIRARRPEYTVKGTLAGLVGYELIGQRFITFTHEGMGISTPLEISRLYRASPGVFEFEAVSVAPTDFDFDPDTEEPDQPIYDEVESTFEEDEIGGIAAVAGDNNTIVVTWPEQDEAYSQIVRWRATGTTEWQSDSASGTEYIITGLVPGQAYEIQVSNAGGFDLFSPSSNDDLSWQPDPALEVVALSNSTPPDDLAAFAAVADGADADVTFTAPNDALYAGVRIWRGATTTFAEATIVQTIYGAANSVGEWTDTGLAAGTYYYWATPINAAGVDGSESGPDTVTIT